MLFCVITGYDYYVVNANFLSLFYYYRGMIEEKFSLICRERDIEINLRFLQFPILIKLALCFAPPTPIDNTNDIQYKRKYKKKFNSK